MYGHATRQIMDLHSQVTAVQRDQKELDEALQAIESSQTELIRVLDALEPEVKRLADSTQASRPADAERER